MRRRGAGRPLRSVRLALVASLVLSGLTAVTVPPVARADGGPSVELPKTPSVLVSLQGRQTPPSQDETAPRALRGNQAPRSTGSGTGNYSATSLTPAATWTVSAQTGTFYWSYPLRVPPAPGGLQPNLGLSYSSSAVDGLTSATNNQASWVGDGWSLWPGFIERAYGGCADDVGGTGDKPFDLCWRTDNATLSLSGGGAQLIRVDGTELWRAKEDDGSRIERFSGAGNGDDNGESWKVTTTDGTQYFFGSRSAAKSTWTVPVYGDDADEPCHRSTFDTSWCDQAYRWNLDKVVDRHGNMLLYSYETEVNHYGRNRSSAAAAYTRGGWLDRVEYGLRDGEPAVAATGRVAFEVTDRCVPGAECALSKPDNLPDVPLDLKCDGGTCADKWAPSFWTTKRLARIVASVRAGTSFDPVDSWTLRHELPDPGDHEKPALWLKGITHTGHAGAGPDIGLPEVTFDGARKPNRVFNPNGDGAAALIRFRMNAIVSETGGITSIRYAEPDCVHGTAMPANPESNAKRCFPAKWAPKDSPPRTDYFHKYVVAQVSNSDRVAGSLAEETHYEYLDGAAWHYDESELTKDEDKTWNTFRGFGRVVIRKGSGHDGPKSRMEQRFYRGMHGDKLPGGGSRTVHVTDSEGGGALDENWLSGQVRESITYNGDGPVVGKSISEPHWQGPTATRGTLKSYIVRPGNVRAYTALEAGGWRITRQENGYDDRGLPTTLNDLADESTAADDRCTRTTYVRNESRWLLAYPSRVEQVAVACPATPTFPDHAVSDVRTAYDGQVFGAAPLRGDATTTEVAKDRPAGADPVYTLANTTAYDSTGRPTESADPLGHKTTNSYTPTTGGPVTQSTATNAAGHTTTTTYDPATGQATLVVDPNGRVTETAYDALGRSTEIWLPNRPRATNTLGNKRFAYLTRNDGPPAVTTTAIGPNGNFVSTTDIFDGLLRKRQAQAPAPGGGRLLTDYRYDSQGRAVKSTSPYVNDKPVDTELWLPTDVDVPGMSLMEFDGAGRPTATAFLGGGVEKWRTTTGYGGDRVHVTPPQGDTATTTLTDARGQTTELRQYRSGRPEGEFDATRYGYTTSGQLASLTDPAGNAWSYSYDLRGRKITEDDPDKGHTTYGYDDAGRVVSTQDSRGVTLAYAYDSLSRRTELHRDSLTGLKLADWTYDTVPRGKGLPAASTRYVDGSAYITRVTEYSSLYQVKKAQVVIPPAENELAGSYTAIAGFNVDGSLAQQVYPGISAGLPTETVSHSYDDLGLISSTSGGFSGLAESYVSSTEHTRYGEVQRLQLGRAPGPKRVWLSTYYDDHTRRPVRSIVDAEIPKPMLSDVNYTYDPAGNITSMADTPREAPADIQCFRYDHLRRLTEAWTPSVGCGANPAVASLTGPAPYWQSLRHDKVGNRLTETQHAAAGDTVREYAPPTAGHRLDSVTTRLPGGTTTLERYGYDPAGNTISRNRGGTSQGLDWDAEGNLTKVTEAGKVTEYLYDADGNRLIRRDPAAVTLYLGGQEVSLDRVTKAKSGTRYYNHGTQIVAMRDSAGLTWLAGDHQGTAQIAVHAGTLAVTQRRQTPFGAARGAAGQFPGEKGFVGGTIDESTGLTTLGARQYDDALGRFISVDPILNPSDPQQLHGYAYANNSPVTMSDPDGLMTRDCDADCDDSKGAHDWQRGHTEIFNGGAGAQLITEGGSGRSFIGKAYVPKTKGAPSPRLLAVAMGNMIAKDSKNLYLRAINGGLHLLDTYSIMQWSCVDLRNRGEGECSREFEHEVDLLRLEEANRLGMLDGKDGGGGSGKGGGRVGGGKSGPKGPSRESGTAMAETCEANSFVPGTLVLLADGSSKPIEDIEIGDRVLATDPETGRTEAREVVSTIVGDGDKHLVKLTVDTDGDTGDATATITATDGHPFWLPELRTWATAAELEAGSWLRTSAGTWVQVVSATAWTASQRVHNLTIDELHTYYALAGTTALLVHNKKCGYHGVPDDECSCKRRAELGKRIDEQILRGTELERRREEREAVQKAVDRLKKEGKDMVETGSNPDHELVLIASLTAWGIDHFIKKRRGETGR